MKDMKRKRKGDSKKDMKQKRSKVQVATSQDACYIDPTPFENLAFRDMFPKGSIPNILNEEVAAECSGLKVYWEITYSDRIKKLTEAFETAAGDKKNSSEERKHFGGAAAWLKRADFACIGTDPHTSIIPDLIACSDEDFVSFTRAGFQSTVPILVRKSKAPRLTFDDFWSSAYAVGPDSEVQVQNLQILAKPKSITLQQLKAHLDKAMESQEPIVKDVVNALDLRSVLAVPAPHALTLPCFQALENACILFSSRGLGKEDTRPTNRKLDGFQRDLRRLESCRNFNILGIGATFSPPHTDTLNGT